MPRSRTIGHTYVNVDSPSASGGMVPYSAFTDTSSVCKAVSADKDNGSVPAKPVLLSWSVVRPIRDANTSGRAADMLALPCRSKLLRPQKGTTVHT